MGDEGGLAPAAERVREPLPDLTAQAVFRSFAGGASDPALLTFLFSMDRLDLWAVDHESRTEPPLEVRLFLEELQRLLSQHAQDLHVAPEHFTRLLANLTTSRCMYLLRYVGDRNERFVDALSEVLENPVDRDAQIACVARRLQAFSKARLLAEIFSGARLARIVRVMGGMS